ncbi:uncharacterized protein KGF55_001676 [Candida pseudojiufengensis]|uniref:uncharacterized protein n=1 Tax=Candida pseudojiufengensis TaxID=497109 RepID=UPI002224F3D7|nr:uncharacterized protein KGF55_001676 [Candida pseudojiufengensis]KAI5964607.1 hypothetical protein KGF55_001676 [Candida pseudojiufengensis]
MSSVTLTKESHKNPTKFRIKYDDCKDVLGPEEKAKNHINDSLPIQHSSSKVSIIGAGFAGIGSAIKTIKDLKVDDITIFEKHDNFGGTWYANTYPGCASDIPALWYSYSFELTSNWSRIQPPQYEMEEYILRVTSKYNLKEKAKFQTFIDKCIFNNKTGIWTLYGHNIKTGQKFEHTSQILLGCSGGLVNPSQLKVEGIENFKGKYMHSAIWDHSVDFKNKDVVVVGNGCSANQVVPALLNDPQYNVKSIFQIARSKHYIMPPVPKILFYLYRLLSFNYFTLWLVRFLVIFIAELRVPLYKGNGILSRIVRWINTKVSVNYMKKNSPKKYHDIIIPDYKIGCKRLIFDYKYVPALNDPRIDVTNRNIQKVVENGIILDNGEFIKADIIVACTGYDIFKSFKLPVSTTDGYSMNEFWDKEGPSAYRTIMVKNIPNFFLIGGPNSATGHSSVVMAIENGIDYYLKVAKPIIEGKDKSVVVKTEAYDNWFKTIQEELRKSVFGTAFGGCISWYASQGVNPTAYAWSQIHYWYVTHFPNYKDLIYKPEDNKKII